MAIAIHCWFEYLANNPFPTTNLANRLKDTNLVKLGQYFLIMASSDRGMVLENCQIPACYYTKKNMEMLIMTFQECIFFKHQKLLWVKLG